jgi:hypothetical protein
VRAILAKGWGRFNFDYAGSCCVVGARVKADGKHALTLPSDQLDSYRKQVETALQIKGSAYAWNDDRKRTKREVLARIDKAIARLSK